MPQIQSLCVPPPSPSAPKHNLSFSRTTKQKNTRGIKIFPFWPLSTVFWETFSSSFLFLLETSAQTHSGCFWTNSLRAAGPKRTIPYIPPKRETMCGGEETTVARKKKEGALSVGWSPSIRKGKRRRRKKINESFSPPPPNDLGCAVSPQLFGLCCVIVCDHVSFNFPDTRESDVLCGGGWRRRRRRQPTLAAEQEDEKSQKSGEKTILL